MKRVIVLMLFLLTGCTVNYNLEIKENLEVEENIIINFDNVDKFIENNGYTNKEEYIQSIYEELSKKYNVKRHKDIFEINNIKNLNDLNNENLEEIYTSFYSECNNNNCKIIAKANKNPNVMIGNYIISINLKNKVLKNNADRIDLIKDTYFWYYNNDVKSDIELVFSKNEFQTVNSEKIKYYFFITIGSLIGIVVLVFVIRFFIKIKRSSLY